MHKPIQYQIYRSKRIKRLKITITSMQVKVTAPFFVPRRFIDRFVVDHQEWIEKILIRQNKQLVQLWPEHFENGELIPYRGGKWPLRIEFHAKKKAAVFFDNSFTIKLPENRDSIDSIAIKQNLIKWMKEQAYDFAQELIAIHSIPYNLKPRKVRIKQMKTRWGSCSASNDISLNWPLILAPDIVFEYLVIHELCHIRHRNHSSDFWALVEKHQPLFNEQRVWLKNNGLSLLSSV